MSICIFLFLNISGCSCHRIFFHIYMLYRGAMSIERCNMENVPLFVLECYRLGNGFDYQGNANLTIEGYPCQKWSSQYPTTHRYLNASLFVDNTLEEISSYCRNPRKISSLGYEKWPWCYTMNPLKRWNFCDIGDFSYCGK